MAGYNDRVLVSVWQDTDEQKGVIPACLLPGDIMMRVLAKLITENHHLGGTLHQQGRILSADTFKKLPKTPPDPFTLEYR